jgi:hypothetical protein
MPSHTARQEVSDTAENSEYSDSGPFGRHYNYNNDEQHVTQWIWLSFYRTWGFHRSEDSYCGLFTLHYVVWLVGANISREHTIFIFRVEMSQVWQMADYVKSGMKPTEEDRSAQSKPTTGLLLLYNLRSLLPWRRQYIPLGHWYPSTRQQCHNPEDKVPLILTVNFIHSVYQLLLHHSIFLGSIIIKYKVPS